MKKLNLRGCGKVFRFVLSRHMSQKSYIALTVTVAILLFGVVFALTLLPNLPDSSAPDSPDTALCPLSQIVVWDTTAADADTAWLSAISRDAAISVAPTVESLDSVTDPYAIMVVILPDEYGYDLNVLTPDGTSIPPAHRTLYADAIGRAFRGELYRRAGIDPVDPTLNYTFTSDLEAHLPSVEDGGEQITDGLREPVEMIVSVIVIFVMYFMVLMYGQTAANSVMLEKTSKLMDFFLVSVSTAALMLGKVLAISLAAIIQVTVWIVSAGGGWWIGTAILRTMVPDADSGMLTQLMSQLDGLFSPPGIVIALLCIIFGFILYCGLAAVGGALASKPEDLSSTNGIFTMALVISYLLALFSGTGLVSTAPWLIYFPFTAILVTPGRAITGSISPLMGLVSVVLVALTAFAVILLAGKVYTMMAFYRGNPPKLSDLPRLLKKNRS